MIQLFERIIKSDILKELSKHKSKYDLDENTYTQFCKNRIDVYMKQIKLKNISTNCNKKYTSRNIFKYKKNRCKARIGQMVMVDNVHVKIHMMDFVKHIL